MNEMTRNQCGSYATSLVDFILMPTQKRGEGVCSQWEMKVSAALLSQKSRLLLKLSETDEISLSQIRRWLAIGFSGSFKQGPGKHDKDWLMEVSWSGFLKIVVEVISAIYGENQEPVTFPTLTNFGPPCPPPSRPGPSRPATVCQPQVTPSSPVVPSSATAAMPTLAIKTGPGPLTECLSSWVLEYSHLNLSSLPLDVKHPPRLRVM